MKYVIDTEIHGWQWSLWLTVKYIFDSEVDTEVNGGHEVCGWQ